MVVNVDKTKDKVIGNGTGGPYSFTGIKLINPENDLKVYIEDSNGNLGTQLVVNINYLIDYSETDTSASFDITLLESVTIPDTEALFVNRGVALDQATKLTRSGEINTRSYEKMTDKTTLQNQDQNSLIESTFRLKSNVLDDVNLELDTPVGNEGKAVIVNGTGDGLIYSTQSITEIEEGLDDLDAAVLAAATSATNAAQSETNAATSANEAEISAEIAKESYKYDWQDDYIDPVSGLAGYTIGNAVLFGVNQWWSKIDQNTATPPTEWNTTSPEWQLYNRGATSNDEFVVNLQESTHTGNGVDKTFDITAENPSFRPTNKNQIFAVTIDTVMISEEDYTVTIDGVTGHSLIIFNDAPPAIIDPNGTYNIIVKGATPKLIEIDTPIDYIKDTIMYNGDVVANTATWKGTVRSDDNTVNITADDFIQSTALTGGTGYINHYLFVGKDNTDTTILEWDTDIDGANLTNITGVKRRIGDDKDVAFPTDGNGDLVYFERKFGTWEFELWSGLQALNTGSFVLNNNYTVYSQIKSIVDSDIGVLNDNSYFNPEILNNLGASKFRVINTEISYAVLKIDSSTQFSVDASTTGTSWRMRKIIGVK